MLCYDGLLRDSSAAPHFILLSSTETSRHPQRTRLIDFLDKLRKLAKVAFGVAARAKIEQFIFAKMLPHLKKSINQAHLENGKFQQTVTYLEKELELNGLEALDETQMDIVTHKQQIEGNQDNAGKINSDTNDSNPNNKKIDRKSRTVYPSETYCKKNYPTERCYVGANASNRPLPWKIKPGVQIGPQKQDAKYMIPDCT